MKNLSDFRKTFDIVTQVEPTENVGDIFPRGFVTLIASEPGSGKTWIALKLACEASIGGSVFDSLEVLAPARRVIFFCGETGTELINERLRLLRAKFNPENVYLFTARDMAGEEFFLDSTVGRHQIIDLVKRIKPELIIFDTLISFHRSDESSQKEMTSIYIFLQALAKGSRAAILCMHHLRKKNTNAPDKERTQDDIIGTSAGIRLAAKVFLLKSETQRFQDEERLYIELKNVKSWWRKDKTLTFCLTTTEKTASLVRISYTKSESQKKSEVILQIIFNSAPGTGFTTQILKAIPECEAISNRTINRVMADLVQKGILTVTKTKGKFIRTESGS